MALFLMLADVYAPGAWVCLGKAVQQHSKHSLLSSRLCAQARLVAMQVDVLPLVEERKG